VRQRLQGIGGLVMPMLSNGYGDVLCWIDPAKRIAAVILMQLVPFADSKALELYVKFEKAVYAGLA
jgi:methyl acetate hydrolase